MENERLTDEALERFARAGGGWENRTMGKMARELLAHRRATPADDLRAENERLKGRLRMIVSHATMGATTGEGMSVNDISVKITVLRNEVYQAGKDADLAEARAREAAAWEAGATAMGSALWGHADDERFRAHNLAILRAKDRLTPPTDALTSRLDAEWDAGYLAGFLVSSEGWNGEYPFHADNDPAADADWLEIRAGALRDRRNPKEENNHENFPTAHRA